MGPVEAVWEARGASYRPACTPAFLSHTVPGDHEAGDGSEFSAGGRAWGPQPWHEALGLPGSLHGSAPSPALQAPGAGQQLKRLPI